MTTTTASKVLDTIAAAWPHPWPWNDHALFVGHVGSIAHGTKIPSQGIDDIDVMAVLAPPPDAILGLKTFDHWCPALDPEGKGPLGNIDVVAYSLRKLTGLLLKGNPNVMSLLWLPDRCILHTSPFWGRIKEQRHRFLSQRVIESHAGYAHDQLRRLGHPNTRGYMGRERRELFEKHGYDIKNASHLIRLLRMGCELAETGELNVDRTDIDADVLMEIKRGDWPLHRVEREAEDGFERLRKAKEKGTLPPMPDYDWANYMLVSLTQASWFTTQ